MPDLVRLLDDIVTTLALGGRPAYAVTTVGGDDTAVLLLGSQHVVVTSDFINYRPAMLTLGVGTYYDYGYVLVGNSLSDLCGSGAAPVAVMLNLMIPGDFNHDAAVDIVRGARDIATSVGAAVVGGDTKGGVSLVGCATVLGTVSDAAELFLRTNARAGDKIALSGAVGDFAAAVYALSRPGLRLPSALRERAIRAIIRPTLPIRVSLSLRTFRAHLGGLDISDGLGGDARLLATRSNVGVSLIAEQIPVGEVAVEVAEMLGIPPFAFALASGGDWQFLFTFRPESLSKIPDGSVVVGDITSGEDCILRVGGEPVPLPTWRHVDFLHSDFVAEIQAVIAHLTSLR